MKVFLHPKYPWIPPEKYWVSEDGIVYKKTKKKGMVPIKAHPMSNGGFMHRICGRGNNVSLTRATVVMYAFGEEQPTIDHKVHHKDGDPTNDRPENLAWKTEKEISAIRMLKPENLERVKKMGKANRSIEISKRKRLTKEEREYVRHAIRTHVPAETILEKLNNKITKSGLAYYRRKVRQEAQKAAELEKEAREAEKAANADRKPESKPEITPKAESAEKTDPETEKNTDSDGSGNESATNS
ncbi:MAG: HNH endonuclease [Bacteroidota bacterium]